MTNPIDGLLSGGAVGFFNADTPVGAAIAGTIADVRAIQSTDFATKKPETWDDGRPKMLIAITIQTQLRTTAEDNGQRGIYVKSWGVQAAALKQAIQVAGGPAATASQVLVPGATFEAAYTGTQPSDFGSPTKLYAYRITPATTVALDGLTGGIQQAPGVTAPSAWAGVGGQPTAPATPPLSTPAPAPVSAPPPAAPTPVTQPATASPTVATGPTPAETARQLHALGLDAGAIAAQLGLDPGVVAMLIAA